MPDDAVVKKIGFTKKKRRWIPKHGDTIYFLSEIGRINMAKFERNSTFGELYEYGNCFKNKEDAFLFKKYVMNYKNTLK